jgi:UDP-N-acetylmuramoyl-tripeptide--D-alanyl-D-alanine ligase
VQGHSTELVNAAATSGASSAQSKFFATSQEAAEFISALAKPGDLILIKGSRGVRMEHIVEALRAKHALRDTTADVSSSAGRH